MDIKDVQKAYKKVTTVKNKKVLFIVLALLTVVITFIAIYFGLMPINFASGGFRFYLVLMALLWSLPLLFKIKGEVKIVKTSKNKSDTPIATGGKKLNLWWIPIMIAGALIALFIVLSVCVSPLFMAKNYRALINVRDNGSFVESVEDYSTMQIPIVDRDLAEKLGDKKMGEDNYGSQFEVGAYTMITFKDTLYWIAPIEYQGFFQWTSKPASPGYILVNATNQADVKIVKEELPYVESAYLGDDLNRKIYFQNMFTFREGQPHLELDDEGKPMYIDAVLKKNFAFTSGVDSVGVIITDAKTGETKYYATSDTPQWVDRIQPAAIVADQLGNWGAYVHGFFNSIFAKKDVLSVSTGINYVHSNGKMYLQTGMTSVGNDESIVGVIMTDMRTKDTVFMRVGGATEWAAAQSAIGAEQAQRFSSSDPIIINFKGVPTYFMMLKDNEGLPKRYAYVNVADYRIVATDADKNAALAAYEAKVLTSPEAEALTVKIKDIAFQPIEGTGYAFMKFLKPAGVEGLPENFEDIVFRAPITLNYEIAFLKAGDTVNVNLTSENIISKLIVAK